MFEVDERKEWHKSYGALSINSIPLEKKKVIIFEINQQSVFPLAHCPVSAVDLEACSNQNKPDVAREHHILSTEQLTFIKALHSKLKRTHFVMF